MKIIDQLDKWVNGESIHNDERGECCPDFSCCNDKMDTPIDVRKRFRQAHIEGDDELKSQMLGMFLATSINGYTELKNVYIAGDPANYEKEQ